MEGVMMVQVGLIQIKAVEEESADDVDNRCPECSVHVGKSVHLPCPMYAIG